MFWLGRGSPIFQPFPYVCLDDSVFFLLLATLLHFFVFKHFLYFRRLPEQRFLEGELLDQRKGCLGVCRWEEVQGSWQSTPRRWLLSDGDKLRREVASFGLTGF